MLLTDCLQIMQGSKSRPLGLPKIPICFTSIRVVRALQFVSINARLTLIIVLFAIGKICCAQSTNMKPFLYLANGEIHASCRTGDFRVTNSQFVESFAVEGTTLALIRNMENDLGSPARLFLIDLRSLRVLSSRKVFGAATVRNVCGSLELEHFPGNADVIAPETIEIKKDQILKGNVRNIDLSCSRDRNAIVYLIRDSRTEDQLVVQDQLTKYLTKIAEHVEAVSVSPQGKVLAFRDRDKICRWRRSDQSKECIDSNAIGSWIEAADDGQVRFTGMSSDMCVYHYPRTKDYTDFCVDVYAWRANESPVLLRKKTEMIVYPESKSEDLLCRSELSAIQIPYKSKRVLKK